MLANVVTMTMSVRLRVVSDLILRGKMTKTALQGDIHSDESAGSGQEVPGYAPCQDEDVLCPGKSRKERPGVEIT